jgi:hypothetical protein
MPVEAWVVGTVDDAHTALAERVLDLVVFDPAPDHKAILEGSDLEMQQGRGTFRFIRQYLYLRTEKIRVGNATTFASISIDE